MQARSSNYFKGIDISSYQNGLEFSAVVSAGIAVVYIKATEGISYVNPNLKQHYQEAKAQGLKIGFYHYYKPGVDAVKQAQYFYNAISGLAYDCLPVIDVEENGGYDAEALSGAVHACLNQIAYMTGCKAMIYTYTSFAKNSLKASYVSMYPLWVADYNNNGYPAENGIWSTWAGYQYSSTGKIDSITVDLDEFTGDVFTDKATYDADIDKLVAKGITTSGDYWKQSVTNNTAIRGDWMAVIIERMTGKSNLSDAVTALVAVGAINSPGTYWLTNCVAGKTVNPQYVKMLIINAVTKLGI